ncbi:MAG: formate dehydrogenase accessory sulfurtransferase FdhD [Anaerolineales bacterium]|jgi:FdhD protein
MMGMSSMVIDWYEYRQEWMRKSDEVIVEAGVSIFVNGVEISTLMCSPQEQDYLALGFLKSEGFLTELAEIDHLHTSEDGCCVDVWLTHEIQLPERRIVTSGCGDGVTFRDPAEDVDPLPDGEPVNPEVLFALFNRLHRPDSLHVRARGVHTSGLADGNELLFVTEDVGRHNTIDKLLGYCLSHGIETRGRTLLTTGRVSSEMLRKGAMMGCPIIASRNSPTSMSVEMARAWNIALAGYVRRNSMRVYAHPERLGCRESSIVSTSNE